MIPKRTASEMMESSGKAEGGPLKRMKEMLKENAEKVTFSNNETREFGSLIRHNSIIIARHERDTRFWKQRIEIAQKAVGELEQTNKEYQEDIEKNRQEIAEGIDSGNLKAREAREEKLQRAAQKYLTKFLEGELEKAGLSLEKESEEDQGEKIGGDGEEKMVENEI
ncbi:uncharacterized protein EAE97_002268 [Botrytis byssoidea]|uniref:Uncharacterized protein n=1 Tax=Botrytis byssoidea TaxID=139641 RepID=A0A9P5IT55_9HELO|nr:uncharacterized protein EAE97_002268 [Botrytis byssoidea]KAF7950716.1 hypothetical protein EAE97_002268 [Botrytis byssoidea]